jgi:hypothetical protein
VAEFVPVSRIGWHATGDGYVGYHTWLLVHLRPNVTQVVTEEVGRGPVALRLARINPGHLHRAHDLWTVSLKFLCES